MRAWLDGVHVDGGLVVPGGPRGHGADLRLGPDGVELGADDSFIGLTWETAASPRLIGRWLGDSTTAGIDAWWFQRLDPRAGGVGVRVDGALIDQTAVLRRRLRSVWNALNTWAADGVSVPCWVVSHYSPMGEADLAAVDALGSILRDRVVLRERMADPARLERLAGDLRVRRLRRIHGTTGLRRSTFEIQTALQALGHVHRYGGRPLPGDPKPDAEVLVAAVSERIAANPFCADLDITDEQVLRVVHEQYLDVEPWPFEALLG